MKSQNISKKNILLAAFLFISLFAPNYSKACSTGITIPQNPFDGGDCLESVTFDYCDQILTVNVTTKNAIRLAMSDSSITELLISGAESVEKISPDVDATFHQWEIRRYAYLSFAPQLSFQNALSQLRYEDFTPVYPGQPCENISPINIPFDFATFPTATFRPAENGPAYRDGITNQYSFDVRYDTLVGRTQQEIPISVQSTTGSAVVHEVSQTRYTLLTDGLQTTGYKINFRASGTGDVEFQLDPLPYVPDPNLPALDPSTVTLPPSFVTYQIAGDVESQIQYLSGRRLSRRNPSLFVTAFTPLNAPEPEDVSLIWGDSGIPNRLTINPESVVERQLNNTEYLELLFDPFELPLLDGRSGFDVRLEFAYPGGVTKAGEPIDPVNLPIQYYGQVWPSYEYSRTTSGDPTFPIRVRFSESDNFITETEFRDILDDHYADSFGFFGAFFNTGGVATSPFGRGVNPFSSVVKVDDLTYDLVLPIPELTAGGVTVHVPFFFNDFLTTRKFLNGNVNRFPPSVTIPDDPGVIGPNPVVFQWPLVQDIDGVVSTTLEVREVTMNEADPNDPAEIVDTQQIDVLNQTSYQFVGNEGSYYFSRLSSIDGVGDSLISPWSDGFLVDSTGATASVSEEQLQFTSAEQLNSFRSYTVAFDQQVTYSPGDLSNPLDFLSTAGNTDISFDPPAVEMRNDGQEFTFTLGPIDGEGTEVFQLRPERFLDEAGNPLENAPGFSIIKRRDRIKVGNLEFSITNDRGEAAVVGGHIAWRDRGLFPGFYESRITRTANGFEIWGDVRINNIAWLRSFTKLPEDPINGNDSIAPAFVRIDTTTNQISGSGIFQLIDEPLMKEISLGSGIDPMVMSIFFRLSNHHTPSQFNKNYIPNYIRGLTDTGLGNRTAAYIQNPWFDFDATTATATANFQNWRDTDPGSFSFLGRAVMFGDQSEGLAAEMDVPAFTAVPIKYDFSQQDTVLADYLAFAGMFTFDVYLSELNKEYNSSFLMTNLEVRHHEGKRVRERSIQSDLTNSHFPSYPDWMDDHLYPKPIDSGSSIFNAAQAVPIDELTLTNETQFYPDALLNDPYRGEPYIPTGPPVSIPQSTASIPRYGWSGSWIFNDSLDPFNETEDAVVVLLPPMLWETNPDALRIDQFAIHRRYGQLLNPGVIELTDSNLPLSPAPGGTITPTDDGYLFSRVIIGGLDETLAKGQRIDAALTEVRLRDEGSNGLSFVGFQNLEFSSGGIDFVIPSPQEISDGVFDLGNLTLPTTEGNHEIRNVILSAPEGRIFSIDNDYSSPILPFIQVVENNFRSDGLYLDAAFVGTSVARVRFEGTRIDEDGTHFGFGGGVTIGGLELTFTITEDPSEAGAYIGRGAIAIPQNLGASQTIEQLSGTFFNLAIGYRPSEGVRLVEFGGCSSSLNLGLSTFETGQICLSYEAGPPEIWEGSAAFELPEVFVPNAPGIEIAARVAGGLLDRISISGQPSQGIPIFGTPVYFTGITLSVLNLAQIEECRTIAFRDSSGPKVQRVCDVPPITGTGIVDMGALPIGPLTNGEFFFNGNTSVTANENFFELAGTVSIKQLFELGEAMVRIIWAGTPPGMQASGNIFFAPFYRGAGSVGVTRQGASGEFTCSLTIPNFIPLVGGWSIGSITVGFSTSPFSFYGKFCINFIVKDVCIGVKINENGDINFGRANEGLRDWEQPRSIFLLDPSGGRTKDGQRKGISISFLSNYETVSKRYSRNPKSTSSRATPLTLPANKTAFIRVSYENAAGDPSFELTAPNGDVYTPETHPFDVTLNNDAFYREVPGARDASYLIPITQGGVYQVSIRQPAGLGQYAVEALVENEQPSVSFTNLTSDGSLVSLELSVNDPENDQVNVSVYLDSDRRDQGGHLILQNQTAFNGTLQTGAFVDSLGIDVGRYWVYTVADDGISPPVVTYSPTPIQIINPSAPPMIENFIVVMDGTTALLSWDAINDENLHSYRVQWSADFTDDVYDEQRSVDSSTNTTVIRNLTPGKNYRFAISAVSLVPESQNPFSFRSTMFNASLDQAFGIDPSAVAPEEAELLRKHSTQVELLARNISLQDAAGYDAGRLYKSGLSRGGFSGSSSGGFFEGIPAEFFVPAVNKNEDENNPPVIRSSAIREAPVGEPYRYQVVADDPDGGSISYELSGQPSGMGIDNQGLISWDPTAGDEGLYDIAVTVTDDSLTTDTQTWLLAATNLETLPDIRFLNTPQTVYTQNQTFVYTPSINRDTLNGVTFTLVDAPSGMSLNAQNGQLTWNIPNSYPDGIESVILLVEDNTGSDVRDFKLFIREQFVLEDSTPATATPVPTATPNPTIQPTVTIPLPTFVPTTVPPTTVIPTTVPPTTVPTTIPTTVTPTTVVPTTVAPTTVAPTTMVPTAIPTTVPPTTVVPTTVPPTTVPTTIPTTVTPTTVIPTTVAPTTVAPTTMVPTAIPTTVPPTTVVPTTVPPTTVPTTIPTTVTPTTVVPTTVPPTTVAPTTMVPTAIPTTVPPTTVIPTTVPPTTVAPTTVAPTPTIDPEGGFDFDRDALTNNREAVLRTNPRNRDTDMDGIEDGVEVAIGTDPLDPNDPPNTLDSDGDLLPDFIDPSPNDPDADQDGYLDGYEVAAGTDPNDETNFPVLGDTNGDGNADNVDAFILIMVFLGLDEKPTNDSAFDINRDGIVDNLDAIILFNWHLGNINTIPWP